MAPIRRYLRITKYSVLEVRIYLDNPSLASSWLLHPSRPVLPRVIESIRPLVFPKLEEENARDKSRAKGGRKRGVKDVVVKDDFEVSIFLTETSTRHSLLTKRKYFSEKGKGRLKSNSKKLTGEGTSSSEAIPVEEASSPRIPVLREESDEEISALADIPSVHSSFSLQPTSTGRRPKRGRMRFPTENEDDEEDEDGLFIDSEDEEPAHKRMKERSGNDKDDDDKKKMAMDTSYDGFSVYGRVLCLVVRRRETANKVRGVTGAGKTTMMEEWITSTQMPLVGDEGS